MNKYRLKRLMKGLSQWQLSKLTSIPQSRISLFENRLIKLKEEEITKIRKVVGLGEGRTRTSVGQP